MFHEIYNFGVFSGEFFLVSGTGTSNVSALNAFDFALLDAGVGDTNLIRLSSILPPRFTQIEPRKPKPGALVATAYAKVITEDSCKISLLGAVVGVGVPEDKEMPGLIMEHTISTVITFKEINLTSDIVDTTEVAGAGERKLKWQKILENYAIDMVEEGMQKRQVTLDNILTKCATIENRRDQRYVSAFSGVILL
jgi:pyruvoyl-dependent arginine decarboxylase